MVGRSSVFLRGGIIRWKREGGLELSLHRGLSGLEKLEAEWRALYQALRPRQFFHDYDWYHCYLEHLHERPDEVVFLTIGGSTNDLLAIVPLERVRTRRFGINIRELRFPAHAHLPLRDLLYAGKGAENIGFARFMRGLRHSMELDWDLLALEPVFPDSCAMRLLTEARPGVVVKEHFGHCSFLTPSNLERVFGRLSKNFRANLARARNKLQQMENTELECAREFPALERAIGEMLDLEASGWKGPEGTRSAIKLHPELVAFYRCVVERFCSKGGCEVDILRAEGRAIAGQLALRVDGTVYQLKIAYDERHARAAPGNMLMEHLLKKFAEEGVQCFHLVSSTGWHRNWRADHHDLYGLYSCNLTWRGVLMLSLLGLRKILRPVYRVLTGRVPGRG